MRTKKLVSLVEAAQRGDQEAAGELYSAFQSELYYYILKTVGDKELAADLTQDAFMEILRSLHKLQDPAAFVTWSRRIAYHICTAHFKKQHPVLVDEQPEELSIWDTLEESRDEFVPGQALEQAQLRQALHKMIDALPQEQRSAIMMRYFDELSVRDIAQIQGVSEGTVKSRLNYGRKAIGQAVADYEKKHDIRLHSLGVLPLLLWLGRLLRQEGSSAPAKAPTPSAVPSGVATGTLAARVVAGILVGSIVACSALTVVAAMLNSHFKQSMDNGSRPAVVTTQTTIPGHETIPWLPSPTESRLPTLPPTELPTSPPTEFPTPTMTLPIPTEAVPPTTALPMPTETLPPPSTSHAEPEQEHQWATGGDDTYAYQICTQCGIFEQIPQLQQPEACTHKWLTFSAQDNHSRVCIFCKLFEITQQEEDPGTCQHEWQISSYEVPPVLLSWKYCFTCQYRCTEGQSNPCEHQWRDHGDTRVCSDCQYVCDHTIWSSNPRYLSDGKKYYVKICMHCTLLLDIQPS